MAGSRNASDGRNRASRAVHSSVRDKMSELTTTATTFSLSSSAITESGATPVACMWTSMIGGRWPRAATQTDDSCGWARANAGHDSATVRTASISDGVVVVTPHILAGRDGKDEEGWSAKLAGTQGFEPR